MAGVPFCALLPLLVGVCGAVTGSRVYPANEGEAPRSSRGRAPRSLDGAPGEKFGVRGRAAVLHRFSPRQPLLLSAPGPRCPGRCLGVRQPLPGPSGALGGRPQRQHRCRGAERSPRVPPRRRRSPRSGWPADLQRSRQRRRGVPGPAGRLIKPVLPGALGGSAPFPGAVLKPVPWDGSAGEARGRPAVQPGGREAPVPSESPTRGVSVPGPAPSRDRATPDK